jgi:hypothetical protein
VLLGGLWLAVGLACGEQVTVDFTVQRLDPAVYTNAASSSMVALNTSAPLPLPTGKRVRTDSSGQALLEGQLSTNKTCRIYVFQQGSLATHGCAKSSFQGSSTVTCQEENTAVYKECKGNLQQTGSAEVKVSGSWLAITYLPDQQLTLVAVADGAAELTPVTGFEERALGQPVRVEAQQFLFTMPDDRLGSVAGLPPRQARPLEELPVVIETLGLGPWYERVGERARQDGVDFPVGPGEPVSPVPMGLFTLHGGGALADERVQDAIGWGVDWMSILASIFPNQEPVVRLDFPGRLMTTDRFAFDPDRAMELLAEADYPAELGLGLVVAAEDGPLVDAGEWMLGYLLELGLQVEYFVEPAVEVPSIIEKYENRGKPVLWLAGE